MQRETHLSCCDVSIVCICTLFIFLSFYSEKIHLSQRSHTHSHSLQSLTLTQRNQQAFKHTTNVHGSVHAGVKMEDGESAQRRGAALLPLTSFFSSSVLHADGTNLQPSSSLIQKQTSFFSSNCSKTNTDSVLYLHQNQP